ncbi:MAG: DUF2628 domain-containing protein, partial [Rhabdochlamydiaceae bacterium]
ATPPPVPSQPIRHVIAAKAVQAPIQSEREQSIQEKIESLDVSEKWKLRFHAIFKAGSRTKFGGFSNWKSLTFKERLTAKLNVLAWLLGFFYYCTKGLWKKGLLLTLCLALLLIGIESIAQWIGFPFSSRTDRALSGAIAFVIGSEANYAYYRLKIYGEDFWPALKKISSPLVVICVSAGILLLGSTLLYLSEPSAASINTEDTSSGSSPLSDQQSELDDATTTAGVNKFFSILENAGLDGVEGAIKDAYKSYDSAPDIEGLKKIAVVDLTAFMFYQNLSDKIKADSPHDFWSEKSFTERLGNRLMRYTGTSSNVDRRMTAWLNTVKPAMQKYYEEHNSSQ